MVLPTDFALSELPTEPLTSFPDASHRLQLPQLVPDVSLCLQPPTKPHTAAPVASRRLPAAPDAPVGLPEGQGHAAGERMGPPLTDLEATALAGLPEGTKCSRGVAYLIVTKARLDFIATQP